jgi:hypothetical protein
MHAAPGVWYASQQPQQLHSMQVLKPWMLTCPWMQRLSTSSSLPVQERPAQHQHKGPRQQQPNLGLGPLCAHGVQEEQQQQLQAGVPHSRREMTLQCKETSSGDMARACSSSRMRR